MTISTASLHSTEFAVGQRYLSDTESELGLGVVVDVDDRCVHILFPQSEETRVYAKNSAPLSRVIFKVGDQICDQEGHEYRVTAVDEVMGVLRYSVEDGSCKNNRQGAAIKPIMETRLAANITLAKPLERLLAGRIERSDWYDLRQDMLRMQSALAGHQLKGMMGARVDIIEHQLYIAHEVGKRIAPRVLLADEVGLGKTIEAGLIIHQQLLTGKAERVLILVPDSLQYQWMIELRRRFNLNFALANSNSSLFCISILLEISSTGLSTISLSCTKSLISCGIFLYLFNTFLSLQQATKSLDSSNIVILNKSSKSLEQ